MAVRANIGTEQLRDNRNLAFVKKQDSLNLGLVLLSSCVEGTYVHSYFVRRERIIF